MSVGEPFNIYREQLSSLYHGLALWDPKPVENLHKQPGHVSIGDVGYLDNGVFMRMFNVTLPWDDPSNKLLGKPPEKYERIEPSYFGNVRENEIREGVYRTHVSEVDNDVSANRHEDSLGQMYQCRAQHCGALLSLPHNGHSKDVIHRREFEDYIRDNVDNWFRWSKKMKLPVDHMEDLILVTGCTLVTSWAAAAFDGYIPVDSDSDPTRISLEAIKVHGGRAQFFWRNIRGNVEYHNSRFDPNVQGPLPQNQCVFIRGFRAKRTLFRTIRMRAAAEPLPDDPDDRREDEIQVTRIPDSSEYRDPLVGILDYIIQKCNEDISVARDIIAIAHDDDLRLIEGVEILTADAIEQFLHGKQMPLLVGNGAAILHDPAGNEPPDSDERRAAFLHDNRNSLDTPETSQMTTEKKKGGFLRQIRSHLFRPMNRASSGFASLLGIRNPPTVPTPIPSSNVSYPALPVASSSQGRSGKHAQATVQHDHKITSTTSARAPSQSSAWFQRPHNDGRQGMRSRKYSSRVQRKKFVPIDVTASRVTPSHLSLRRTWSAPAALRRANLRAPSHSSRRNSTVSLTVHRGPFRSGRRRDRTRSISRQSSATSQIQAETRPERRGSQSRSTFALQSLLPNDFRFRILVVGKRDCGKSSLIRTIFKADMSRSPINVSGRTAEFLPPDNRHLIVHECSAFGPGEMQAIRDFITTRNHKSCADSKRLHAVWICIPMSDVIRGQVDEGVKMLLDIGVPFVIVFTKFDLIVPNISSSQNDYEERCLSLFGNVPAEIVSTQPKFRQLINKLVATTDGVINAHSGNISSPSEEQRLQPRLSHVSLAWSVSQRASREINIQAAIEVGQSKYWRGLWSGDDFRGQTLASCIKVIHADIVGVWNLPNKDRYLYSKEFREEISYLVQELSGSPSTTSRPKTGPAWLTDHHENSTEKISLVVGYITDLTLILCRVFSSRNVSPGEVQSAINSFAGSSLKTSIHNDISSFITTVPQFPYHDNDVIIAKIRDLSLRNCDPPWRNAPVLNDSPQCQ